MARHLDKCSIIQLLFTGAPLVRVARQGQKKREKKWAENKQITRLAQVARHLNICSIFLLHVTLRAPLARMARQGFENMEKKLLKTIKLLDLLEWRVTLMHVRFFNY